MINRDKFGSLIYHSKFQIILRYGEILLSQGYSESFIKPNLFFKKLPEGLFFADMRGTEFVPINEDTSPLFYWHLDKKIPLWKRRRLIEQEYTNLLASSCDCRLSFEWDSSPEFPYDESTFIDWDSGDFFWSNGYCKFCKKDMQKEGLFCCKECEEKYDEGLKESCEACKKKIDFGKETHHHVSYFPEKTIPVHKGCHNHIHKTDKYPELKPSEEDIRKFYGSSI